MAALWVFAHMLQDYKENLEWVDIQLDPICQTSFNMQAHSLVKKIFGSAEEVRFYRGGVIFDAMARKHIVYVSGDQFPHFQNTIVLNREYIASFVETEWEKKALEEYLISHELVHLEQNHHLKKAALDIGWMTGSPLVAGVTAVKVLQFAKGPVGMVVAALSYWGVDTLISGLELPVLQYVARRHEKIADLRGFAACSEEGKVAAIRYYTIHRLNEINFPTGENDPWHPPLVERITYLRGAWYLNP